MVPQIAAVILFFFLIVHLIALYERTKWGMSRRLEVVVVILSLLGLIICYFLA